MRLAFIFALIYLINISPCLSKCALDFLSLIKRFQSK